MYAFVCMCVRVCVCVCVRVHVCNCAADSQALTLGPSGPSDCRRALRSNVYLQASNVRPLQRIRCSYLAGAETYISLTGGPVRKQPG